MSAQDNLSDELEDIVLKYGGRIMIITVKKRKQQQS
jgi:hypothetical protein